MLDSNLFNYPYTFKFFNNFLQKNLEPYKKSFHKQNKKRFF